MNELPPTETGTLKRATVSKKLTAKNTPKPRKPRTVDPAEEAINLKWRQEKAALRNSRTSARILATIIDKRVPKLTPGDKEKLADHLALNESVTPALPGVIDSTLTLPHPDGGLPLDPTDRGV